MKILPRLKSSLGINCGLIFAKDAEVLSHIAQFLRKRRFKVGVIDKRSAKEHRHEIMERLEKGKLDFLLSTEMFARGLDAPHITHIINFDSPSSAESYVHRAGRVGRLMPRPVVLSTFEQEDQQKGEEKEIERPYAKRDIVITLCDPKGEGVVTKLASRLSFPLQRISIESGEVSIEPIEAVAEDAVEESKEEKEEEETK